MPPFTDSQRRNLVAAGFRRGALATVCCRSGIRAGERRAGQRAEHVPIVRDGLAA